MKMSIKDRFESKYIKDPSGCWLWHAGVTSSGYGAMYVSGKMELAHRIQWELINGNAPGELFVCHHCDVPRCVNPNHLFLGTQKDNIQDMVKKGRRSHLIWTKNNTHCKHGHLFDEKNTRWVTEKSDTHNDCTYRACKLCYNTYMRRWRAKRKANG
ncbi:hypothetical protein LCGC14_2327750 [marine sediment metagenome]|uniref:HNH nuclease domain-containing protein n=1 Tax=marine sediment metagenome TaxID=412755 RepID=A0A0F9CGH7_9ZZZZ